MTWHEKLIIWLLVAIFAGALIEPYYEAKTFNKFSNQKATYWDAVFGDLRIFAK